MSRVSTLLDLLERYEPTPGEAESLAAIMELLFGDGDIMSADFFEPGHITGSAFVIDRTGTELLLIHHRKLDTWLQPGGHVDPGEDVLAAAIREVEEETGIVATPATGGIFDVDVHPIPARGARPAHTHFDVRFRLVAQSSEFVDSEEVLDVRWVPLNAVSDLVDDASVLRAVEKLTQI